MSGKIIHGGGITAAAALYGGAVSDWLDLSTGINPNPVEVPVLDMRVWHRLPDAHLVQAARQAAQAHYRSGETLPLAAPGTQSLIQLLPQLLAQTSGRVAILSPTYGEYAKAFVSRGYVVDAIGSLEAVRDDHLAVIVVNPNNPTGRSFAPADLMALAARLEANKALLVVDEAFGDMQPGLSLAALAGRLPNLLVFRSFGKFFGLAGLRLGFAIGADEMLAVLEDGLGPWAVSGPALALAADLMGGNLEPVRARIAERKAGLTRVLTEAGLTILGGTELFSLVEHERAAALFEHLAQNHILVRRFDYAPTWLRIGLAPDAACDARLAQVLAAGAF